MEFGVAIVREMCSVGREHEGDDYSFASAVWFWWGTLEGVMSLDERRRGVDLSVDSYWLCRIGFPEELVGFKMEMGEY